MDARIAKDEARATRFVTEEAMQQHQTGKFSFLGEFVRYEIQSEALTDEKTFKFQVALFSQDEMLMQLEIIRVVEILEEYYIDSVLPAG